MWEMLINEIRYHARSMIKLYITNAFALFVIIFLLAYRDGATRQINLQKTAFAGEVVVKFGEVTQSESELMAGLRKIPHVELITRKLRSRVDYRISGAGNALGSAEILGVDFENDLRLVRYLSLFKGRLPQNDREILVPESLLQMGDVGVGHVVYVQGKTSAGVYNAMSFKVCGIYRSSKLTLFETPRLIVRLSAMEKFFMPKISDREFGLFFRGSQFPDEWDALWNLLKDAMGEDIAITYVDAPSASIMDVMDITTQFNIFLLVVIAFVIIALLSLVMLVNFNISSVLYRQRQPYVGAMMAMGIARWRLALMLYLESLVRLVLSLAMALVVLLVVKVILDGQVLQGVGEMLFMLLSGTSRVDLYLRPWQIGFGFGMTVLVMTLAEIPVLVQLVRSTPCELLVKNVL